MGPVETLQSECSQYYNELKRKGLNPFDLLSWDSLLNLEYETRFAGRNGKYEGQQIHKITRRMIWDALYRKAEDLDMADGTSEHVMFLDERRSGA